ncbi:MAG: spermidine/putrescine ABC transporter substrate-binding protein [Clostridia bacterium]|nr:spermidine/putrescine ABC transporter substrate-binding protein [Clostridia bacterium]MBQ8861384.1 spermidine/putrescine ABC transporter substrate-binding protein [Clostridia bacterium]
MKKIISVFLVVLLFVCTLSVSAFAEEDAYAYDMEYYSKFKGQNVTIYVYNWGEYISDGSDDSMDVVKEFEALTGINVEYTTFDSNESLFAKLKSGSASYDVIIPSDYMVSRLADNGMLAKLDYANIPNFDRYIDAEFKNPEYDAANEYSVPYMWGTVGVIYNTKYVDEADIGSWDLLWNEKYAGKILMFDNSRDAFAIALSKLGYSMNTTDAEELKAAAAELAKQGSVVQAYVMDQIFDKMVEENAYVAPYYAGDYLTMAEDNEDLAFYIPKEGTNLFTDAMCIPSTCQNKAAAEMFINFMCEPTVSAANTDYICYSTPISAAKELIDPEMAESEIAYPSAEVLAKTERYKNLSDEANQLMDDLWISGVRTNELTPGFWISLGVICVLALAAVFRNMYVKKKRMEARMKY